MESQPQNPEFKNNPENFHPCIQVLEMKHNIKAFCSVGRNEQKNKILILRP